MAVNTTPLTISTSAYTLAASSKATVLIHGNGNTKFEVIVAQTLPAATAAGDAAGEVEGYAWSGFNLGAGDNVYVRACNPGALTVMVTA